MNVVPLTVLVIGIGASSVCEPEEPSDRPRMRDFSMSVLPLTTDWLNGTAGVRTTFVMGASDCFRGEAHPALGFRVDASRVAKEAIPAFEALALTRPNSPKRAQEFM
jgi:hypothetical protein